MWRFSFSHIYIIIERYFFFLNAVNFMAIIYSWICFIYRIRRDWIIFAFILMYFAALSWVLIGDFRQRLSWALTSFILISGYLTSICVCACACTSQKTYLCVLCMCWRWILSLSRISIPVKWLCIIYYIALNVLLDSDKTLNNLSQDRLNEKKPKHQSEKKEKKKKLHTRAHAHTSIWRAMSYYSQRFS